MNITPIHHNKGFTLIELMVVVGIIAITMGIGMPSFQTAIASNRLTASVNDMVVALQLARSESIKQMRFGGVVFNNNSSWDTAILGATASNNVILQQYTAASGVTYTWNSVEPQVKFRSDGRMSLSSAIIVEFTIAGNAMEKRRLRIQPSGQVKVCTVPSTETCPF